MKKVLYVLVIIWFILVGVIIIFLLSEKKDIEIEQLFLNMKELESLEAKVIEEGEYEYFYKYDIKNNIVLETVLEDEQELETYYKIENNLYIKHSELEEESEMPNYELDLVRFYNLSISEFGNLFDEYEVRKENNEIIYSFYNLDLDDDIQSNRLVLEIANDGKYIKYINFYEYSYSNDINELIYRVEYFNINTDINLELPLYDEEKASYNNIIETSQMILYDLNNLYIQCEQKFNESICPQNNIVSVEVLENISGNKYTFLKEVVYNEDKEVTTTIVYNNYLIEIINGEVIKVEKNNNE